jgi:hypothetical protein
MTMPMAAKAITSVCRAVVVIAFPFVSGPFMGRLSHTFGGKIALDWSQIFRYISTPVELEESMCGQ